MAMAMPAAAPEEMSQASLPVNSAIRAPTWRCSSTRSTNHSAPPRRGHSRAGGGGGALVVVERRRGGGARALARFEQAVQQQVTDLGGVESGTARRGDQRQVITLDSDARRIHLRP